MSVLRSIFQQQATRHTSACITRVSTPSFRSLSVSSRLFEEVKPSAESSSSADRTPSSIRRRGPQATPEQVRAQNNIGMATWQTGGLFLVTFAGLWWYFDDQKKKVLAARQQELEKSQKIGKPSIGGPFTLQSTPAGKDFTEQDLLGKWSLIYFGFTNCPDICPDELDKMGEVVEALDKKYGAITQPIFISCDPARDTLPQMNAYIKDFHPRLIGLRGTYEATKALCKVYRVYFSTPKDSDPRGDYLVDHSIFFYLMDPNGEFVEAFGKASTADDVITKTEEEMKLFEKQTGRVQEILSKVK